MIKHIVGEALRKAAGRVIVEPLLAELARRGKSSPTNKVAQRALFNYWQRQVEAGARWSLHDVGFRNFSQFEEDGLLLYIFAAIGTHTKTFVDIGAGDGINSNCANLAINFGWGGLFIDGDEQNVAVGREFYSRHADTWAHPPRFVRAFVQRENINQVLTQEGLGGEVDLVSIDLDGNDFWIWDAVTTIDPRVVIVETHVEFGTHDIVVPYDKNYCYPGKHPDYHGASPVAMAKLADRKGYRLVGANAYGFNTIYVKRGIGEDVLPEVAVESVLRHPRNIERFQRFNEIADWEYVTI